MSNERLGQALRLIRVFHDMSRKDIMEHIKISSPYLSEIERGKKAVSMGLVKEYSRVFNIPVSSIMFFSENLDPESRSEKTRNYLANKIIKMLEWLELTQTPEQSK